jgi:hypothetical protein
VKSARDRAVDVMHRLFGFGFSREVFTAMISDRSERGQTLRDWVDAIEAGIEQDRREIERARGPS